MRSAIEEWLAYCRRNNSPETVDRYQRILWQFCAHSGDKALTALTVAHVEQYIDTLLHRGHGHNTCNTHLAAVKSFWSWETRRHGTPNIAAAVPRLTPDDPVQRFLSEEEYARVLAICGPVAKDLVQLYGNTGLRRGEMLRLRWPHVAPDMRALRVPHGKGNKARTVPVNGVCRDILSRNRVDDTFSFLLRYGSPSGQDRLCGRLAGQAAIPPFGPHALRHYFATRMIRAGIPLKIVSKILGHSSVAITEKIYCHLMPVDLLGTTESLSM